MCLIITQPAGLTLSRSDLLDIFARNGDGFGIMRAHRGTLHTWRMVGDAADMLDLYHAHAAGRACVLHWRMATHGEINVDNAHPFTLTRDVAVVHNGMLDIGTPTQGKSDTWHMAQHVLAPIARDNPNALFNADMVHALGGMIGRNNKLVFQHADGRVAIVNRSAGVDYRGCWYSNTYAWDAPASVRPVAVARYGREWWETTSSPSSASSACTSSACAVLDSDSDALYMAEAVRAELLEVYETRGEVGVLEWIERYPTHAVELLCEGYRVESAEAAEYVRNTPASVAEWLADLVHAEAI